MKAEGLRTFASARLAQAYKLDLTLPAPRSMNRPPLLPPPPSPTPVLQPIHLCPPLPFPIMSSPSVLKRPLCPAFPNPLTASFTRRASLVCCVCSYPSPGLPSRCRTECRHEACSLCYYTLYERIVICPCCSLEHSVYPLLVLDDFHCRECLYPFDASWIRTWEQETELHTVSEMTVSEMRSMVKEWVVGGDLWDRYPRKFLHR